MKVLSNAFMKVDLLELIERKKAWNRGWCTQTKGVVEGVKHRQSSMQYMVEKFLGVSALRPHTAVDDAMNAAKLFLYQQKKQLLNV